MDTSLKRQDYHKHFRKKGERAGTVFLCVGITGILAYFFYRSAAAMIPLSTVGIIAFRRLGRDRAERARKELAAQFRECILSVSASLQAGYSVENSFLECRQDMVQMYGEEALICSELSFIRRGLAVNIPLEELLADVAERSGCDDIAQFSQIFSPAKRSGGNMADIIRSSAGRIGKQIELRQELQMLLGGKKMELTVMKIMPFGILLYIDIGNPGYFDTLYHNPVGIVVMTGCLGIYLGAYLLGEHIMERITAEMT